MVGGSGSIAHSFQQYRELGAKTRAMLVAAAAARWNVAPDQLPHRVGRRPRPRAGQSSKYGELAADAARQPVPATVKLKEPSEFKLIGKQVKRLDSRAKCDGSLKFGLDLDLPGMLVAVVARPPVWGAKVKSFDDTRGARRRGRARGLRDSRDARRDGRRRRRRQVLAREARPRPPEDRVGRRRQSSAPTARNSSSSTRRLARTAGLKAAARGDAKAIERVAAADLLVAEYEFPYLPHAPMEPLNTTVRFDGDAAEVWAGSQFQTFDHAAVAEVLGLKPERVNFHTEMAGGGFGRRAVPDSHVQREAASIAKRFKGTPVKLVWSREDDIRGGYYRPMHVHRVEIGVGRGRPARRLAARRRRPVASWRARPSP